ncbi:hypothetical protein BC834DRAFT_1029847 [Gloeopeniophorella convolvens]|nr:hypothetical protein BC834DRAFT_1029847 [Gloeopeniophorella convolvens]
MNPVHFKLSISDGLTRRVSFPILPSWNVLAARIQALYNIPLSRVGASYVDADGDEVTLSSEDELRDFYDTIQPGQLIKFHVVDLGSLRGADKASKDDPPSPQSSTRNTFGGPPGLIFEVDQDWERLPLGNVFIPSPLDPDVNFPHAFVEVVDEDVEKESEPATDPGDVSSRDNGKGKARDLRASVADDVSSSVSMLGEETSSKPPIHVQVHGLRPMSSGTFGPPPAVSTPARESVTPTPVVPPSPAGGAEFRGEATQPSVPGSFPDPSTPELDPSVDPNVSLSNDLASLLNSLNGMFLEHPEVGQHLRSLFRNVGSGSYWNAQRDSMARVAEDIQRAARDAQAAAATGAQRIQHAVQEVHQEIHQRAQQEAARRVTEAIANILRAFGAGDVEPSSEASFNPSTGAPRSPGVNPVGATQAPHPPGAFPLYHPPNAPSQWDTTPRQSPLTGATSLHPSSAMSPPFRPGMPPPPVGVMPPPPPGVVGAAPAWNQFRPFPGATPDVHDEDASFGVAPPPEVSYYIASANRRARPSASELKASLEAAKANYKAEKERYRQEQEARRRERRRFAEGAVRSPRSPTGAQAQEGNTSDSMSPSDAEPPRPFSPPTAVPPPLRQIISNARGGFPQWEMNNVPRSPAKQRGDRAYRDNRKAQHIDTVVERLEGMGFHESVYPALRTVVGSRLPGDGTEITKEMEDDVMSEVLEKLLEANTESNSVDPSGSGVQAPDFD